MASAYTNDLRLEEIGTGEQSGTWGDTTNTNLELIAEAFSFGTEAITTNANTHTSTIADGGTDEARSIYLKYTGALDSDCTITIGPNTVSKLWFIENATTDSGSSGPYNIIIKQGSGAAVTVPNGHVKAIFSDGAGSGGAMVEAFKDLNVTDNLIVSGSTPTLTIGDAGEEDTKLVFDGNAKDFYVGLDDSADKLVLGVGSSVGTNGILTLDDDSVTIGDGAAVDSKIVFDGNAQDFYVGLDDSADDLVIGHGSTVGTNPAIEIDENQDIKFAQSIGVGQAASSTTGDIRAQTMSLLGTTPTLTLGDGGEEDVKIQFNGVKDFYIANDDSADKLVIGEGSTVGTNSILTITDDTVTLGDGAAVDTALIFDGNAQDFYVALDDSADDLLIGNGSTVGSNIAIGINASQVVKFNDAYTFPTSDGSANQVLQTNGSGALSFAAVSGTTINNNADNRLITGSGTANTLEGEANATWNGNTLALTAGAGNTGISLTDGSTNYGFIGGGNALKSGGSANDFSFRTDTGSIDFYTNGQNLRFAIESDGVINTSELVRIGSGSTFENEACNIKKTGSNDDAVLALDSDTGDASFYRFMRFYRKNANSSLAKLDYDLSGDSISLAVESDERYKEITGPAVGLDLISRLEPIKYTRKETGVTDGCGFGAQSYKKAFDDIGEYARGVTVGSDTEKWELDYSPLVPNLVKAVQEQQEQIQALQNEIQQLKGGS